MKVAQVIMLSVGLLAASALLRAESAATQPAEAKRVTESGLIIIDKGGASGAKNGDTVYVHYTGKLTNGAKFDSSYDRAEPLELVLGRKQVIQGWEEGLLGMSVGDKRQLIIPPNLAYGDRPNQSIPANSTLIFDVELMGLRRNQ